MHHIRIPVSQRSFENLLEIVEHLRTERQEERVTQVMIAGLADVSRDVNRSYFLVPTQRLGADESVVRSVQRATDIAVRIQSTLLQRVLPKLSGDDLLAIADLLEIRIPIHDRRQGYFLRVPVTDTIVALAEEAVRTIRTGGSQPVCIARVVDTANAALEGMIEYFYVDPLQALKVKTYVLTVVKWASKLWITMHAFEHKRLCRSLSPGQLQIYADIIEGQIHRHEGEG